MMIYYKKQVLSITIKFRVSDTVEEFKMFNKSLFLHLPCMASRFNIYSENQISYLICKISHIIYKISYIL